ncbi:MAG TPA: PfkB family carbohydrate kinase, partial [Solirubrobacter sp.]
MTIVVGGEALIDLVPHEAGELRAHAGGGPYNTARTLGRLEQDVHYLGCISDDGFGGQLRAKLIEDGVKLDTVVETPLPTTLALAELDPRGAATYRFYSEGTSAPALEPEAALAALPAALVAEEVLELLQPVTTRASAAAPAIADPILR